MSAELVRSYLTAMEKRDLVTAQTMLADTFVMHFPGAKPMSALAELIEWSEPRYRFVTKTYVGFDQADGPLGPIIFCRGTLAGEWPDGTGFEGIRFIDRFEIVAGKITRQDVWNDMAEARSGGAA